MVSLKSFVVIVSFIQYAESITPPNCAAVSCLAPDCPNSYTPPGECCPVCPKVHATEKAGSCPRPRGHGICVSLCGADSDCPLDKKCCSNGCGQVCQSPEGAVLPDKCSLVRCAMPANCMDTYIPKGQCCPVCRTSRSCFHKGTLYKDGQTFKDDCNFCSCRNGRVSCTKMACNPDIKVKPGKCPSHLGLGGGGICVEQCSGDSDCPLNQKCCSNGCGRTCQNSESTDCSRVICPACVGFTKPGECCPTCSSVVA